MERYKFFTLIKLFLVFSSLILYQSQMKVIVVDGYREFRECDN